MLLQLRSNPIDIYMIIRTLHLHHVQRTSERALHQNFGDEHQVFPRSRSREKSIRRNVYRSASCHEDNPFFDMPRSMRVCSSHADLETTQVCLML